MFLEPTSTRPRVGWRRYAGVFVRHSIQLMVLGLGLFVAPLRSSAHTASTAYLQLELTNQMVHARLELSLRDLEDRLGLDANDDGQLTWGELRSRERDVFRLVQEGLRWGSGSNIWALTFSPLEVDERQGEGYAVVSWTSPPISGVNQGELQYHLFFQQDPLHRCLVAMKLGEGRMETAVLSPVRTSLRIDLHEHERPASLAAFVREGTHHIWTGYDHLLFLLALLLPAVLRRTSNGWAPAADFMTALKDVLKVVTAFTVAHSLTLALAALEVVRLPSRWVESTIAASIIVAAFANLVPRAGLLRGAVAGGTTTKASWFVPWKVAFLFGLIHGFGFAGVLSELGLRRSQLALPLVGFNLGVELGQLVCVGLFLPMAFWLRSTPFYRRGALPVGSVLILLLAGGWLIERAFDVGFMPI